MKKKSPERKTDKLGEWPNGPGVPKEYGGSDGVTIPVKVFNPPAVLSTTPTRPPLRREERERLIDIESHVNGLEISYTDLRGRLERMESLLTAHLVGHKSAK